MLLGTPDASQSAPEGTADMLEKLHLKGEREVERGENPIKE
jgi:hypothetical protein